MREVLNQKQLEGIRFGITPAYAGSTEYVKKQLEHFRDHPRVCGKYHMLSLIHI